MSISIVDRGYRKLIRRLKEPARFVTVGIHNDDGAQEHSDGLTIAEVGAFHEFGLGNNPRRSFIADWADENRAKHTRFIGVVLKDYLVGKHATIDQASELVGIQFQGEIQRRIAQTPADWPELKQETIDRKGSSKPLIDTGALRGAITYDVHKT